MIRQKQGDRERKKQELEAEFSSVFTEIREKKQELARLEQSIVDMESQRQRKDREFARLQKNLLELLTEQKAELDSLRERGLQLEVATATSAGNVKPCLLPLLLHTPLTHPHPCVCSSA